MLLDKPNIELLKLIAQCKDFPVSCPFSEVFMLSRGNAGKLYDEGLLKTSRDQRRYRVSQAGYALLDYAGIAYPENRYLETDPQTLRRREQSALVSLTLLLAGVDVYATDVPQLRANTYLSGGNLRRAQRKSGRNLTGNTRFSGLMPGFVFYYMSDPQDSLFYQQETRFALTLLAQSRSSSPAGTNSAVVYMGKSYSALIAAVTAPSGNKATYRTAYEKFTMSVRLCPCTPDGAFQVRLMLQPDYRNRLLAYLFASSGGYDPPNPFFGSCDGMMGEDPFILGVDMDLRRITDVVKTAREWRKTAHIFARPCQCEALKEHYNGGDVRLYKILDEEIQRVFSFPSFLAEPPIEPYITKGGQYIHDETLRACREARKAHRKKDKAPEKENQA